jgi:hypothetical protein
MIVPMTRASRSGREATIGSDDETPVLVLLLALAAALYLVVWLVERPGDGEGLSSPCLSRAAPRRRAGPSPGPRARKGRANSGWSFVAVRGRSTLQPHFLAGLF